MFPSRSQVVSTHASEGTHLNNGRPPLFVFICMWVLLFVAVVLCFQRMRAICVYHLPFVYMIIFIYILFEFV
jgi:L-asparagine transporter-like permease